MRSIGLPEIMVLFALPFTLGYLVLLVFVLVKFFQMAADVRAIRRILTDNVRPQPPA